MNEQVKHALVIFVSQILVVTAVLLAEFFIF